MNSLSEEQFLKELRKEIRLYRKRIREHEQSIEHDLYELGFDVNVRIKVYPGFIARGMDYIAEAEFL